MCAIDYILIASSFFLLVFTSGRVIRFVLKQVSNKQLEEVAASGEANENIKKRLEIGSIIGKCEKSLSWSF